MYQGNTLRLTALDDGVVELTFDLQGESVNKFNARAVTELSEALDLLEARSELTGVLVTSAKSSFMVGADIAEFEAVFAAGGDSVKAHLTKNIRNFNRLEDLPVPVVALVDSHVLGGGMELCLACDYRIAAHGARLGLPETKLGIIPGWGGTVRLPRLAGVDTAVEWIASGRDYKADAALKVGVVDAVVDSGQLHAAGLHTLAQCRSGLMSFQARRKAKTEPLRLNPTEAGLAFESSKGVVAAQAGKHYPAPLAAVKVMQKAAGLSREQALELETETFAKLASTPTAQALVGLFLNDQKLGKKAKQWASRAEKPVNRAAVLGAGIMGGGIAYQSAVKGTPVKLKDIAQAGIDQGLAEANKLLAKQVERGRLDVRAMGDALNRIEPALSYDGFEQVDIVVEAVVERADVKKAVLAETERQVSQDVILASNTSTISITSLAESLQRPENFCGMHFFNPVHAMPLVEVIRGERSSDEAIARTVAYAQALGKKPVVVKDCPGFLVNRVLFPYFAGFAELVREGVDYRRIDRVMESWGWPMGPAYLLDVVGLDTALHAESVMAEAFPDRLQRKFVSCTEALHNAGRLGQKNERGFYDYQLDRKGKPQKVVSEEAEQLINAQVEHKGADIDDETLIARMMVPMATELMRCLDEGIVESPAEADMALIYGIGFPPFRGGVLRWIDSLGADAFSAMLSACESLGPLYQLPPSSRERFKQEPIFYPRPS
ncbi:fatty acid oxidation complex subunit alpha FadB [Marinimicrobium sp. ABcell2]|uniref:fatty acid oxidation complex subunit alpha FadB n=1 Tax=Marinimicrobium sp. ABcell2 TaxID=3069751 RepID=UPI0027B1A456|nr:fatty acid oxidation complex subunit alpha FadB [Marinimicrobium sp. ABcell2]MDQ2075693.1 fatty acid oxidation complex subunit alpha FadB [Marinimicrobium sp. ABcell2]